MNENPLERVSVGQSTGRRRRRWRLTAHLACWLVGGCLVLRGSAASGDDWPTFQLNNRRNAVSQAELDPAAVPSMSIEWEWTSPEPPHPAWYGPAKWDAYAQLKDLKSMRAYDTVYHVVVAGEFAYFSSSADDSVHCLYADNGQKRWVHTTGGPVRVPPAISDGKIYFGSDDGHVYCLNAEDGKPVWKYRPGPEHQRVLNDGRLISLWPCRSGVAVDRGTAYFTASLLPWNHGYLCAVDAATGKITKPEHFARRIDDVTMEGPIALSATDIIVPQGRVSPILFSRKDGSSQGSLKGGGGSFVVLSGEQVFHGPGNKAGWITSSDLRTRDVVATFKMANAMVIDAPRSFLLTATELVASDMEKKEVLWRVATDCTHSLIKVGEVAFLGGQNKVCAIGTATGELLWSHTIQGTAQGLSMARGKLFVSTDGGALYAFSPRGTNQAPPQVVDRVVSRPTPDAAEQPAEEKNKKSPAPPELVHSLAVGPWVQFQDGDSAQLRWHSRTIEPSVVEVDRDGTIETIRGDKPTREHAIELSSLPHRSSVRFRIVTDAGGPMPWFELDTFFNYTIHRSEAPLGPSSTKRDEAAGKQHAEAILSTTSTRAGICVLMGMNDGVVAHELIKNSRLKVIGFDTDEQVIQSVRSSFLDAGLYGSRFSCHHVADLGQLPMVGDVANLVSSENTEAAEAQIREAERVARPEGAVVFVTPDAAALKRSLQAAGLSIQTMSGPIESVVGIKVAIPAAGTWTHIYGNADNALYGGESLGSAGRSADFQVQWLGRPGPRFQPDRNGRKPPPLAAAGKLFLQGLQRIVTVDQYNGTVLWSLEIPDLGRFNVPRDCGNWCTNGEQVFVAIRDRCWVIDADSGQVQHQLPVPIDSAPDAPPWDWGYIAQSEGVVLGSAVQQDASWKSYWGGSGWYDSEKGEATHKVCSDYLFALDAHTQKMKWRYGAGLVLNPTITATGDRVYFVECRNEAVVKEEERRLGGESLWSDLYLVGLDLETGDLVAERELSIVGGDVVIYLAHSGEHLVLVSSANTTYHVYSFSGEDCKPIWDTTFRWGKGKADHGSHLSRPAIVGDKLFVRPAVMDLKTGQRLPLTIPVAGCGTYAATDEALFFRAGSGKNSAVWNSENGEYTTWSRLRPDCWLSTIPAGGMLLSPEGGGGCSCGSWMETSIGFMPISRVAR